MWYRTTNGLIFLFLAICAVPAAAETFPFTGVIKGDKVNIRAGAGQTYYIVTQLDTGQLVRVHKNVFGWYQITPPEGSFCFISKEAVKPDADGKTGSVVGRAPVKAAAPGGPERSYRRLLVLAEGARVGIVGEENGFFKIHPPEGAHLFVKKDLVDIATDAQIAAERGKDTPPATAPEQPKATPAPQPAVTQTEPAAPTIPAPPVAETKPAKPQPAEPKVETPAPATPVAAAPAPATPPVQPAPLSKQTNPAGPIFLDVTSDGSVRLGGTTYAPDKIAEPVGLIAQTSPRAHPVRIRGAKDVAFSKFAAVLEAANRAGLTNVLIEGQEAAPVAANQPQSAEADGSDLTDSQLIELEGKYDALAENEEVSDKAIENLQNDYKQLLAEKPEMPEKERSLAKARIDLLGARRQVVALRQDLDSFKKDLEKSRQQREIVQRANRTYTATGLLKTSSIYNGNKLPLLYRLVDPNTQLTEAYVEPKAGVDMKAMIGQLTGVVGLKRYDATLKLKFIRPSEVEPLHAGSE